MVFAQARFSWVYDMIKLRCDMVHTYETCYEFHQKPKLLTGWANRKKELSLRNKIGMVRHGR